MPMPSTDGDKDAVIFVFAACSAGVWTLFALTELQRWSARRRCCRTHWLGGVFEPCPCADRGGLPPQAAPLLAEEEGAVLRGGNGVRRASVQGIGGGGGGGRGASRPWEAVELPADLCNGRQGTRCSALLLLVVRLTCLVYVAYIWIDGLLRNPRFTSSLPNNLGAHAVHHCIIQPASPECAAVVNAVGRCVVGAMQRASQCKITACC
jgi:hypothetical protein